MKVEEYLEKRKELQEFLAKNAKEMLAALFAEALKEVKVIGWKQYTPYFNDGDPCVFRTRCEWAATTDEELQQLESEEIEEWDLEGNFPDCLNKHWDSLEDALLEAFGDHVEVKAYLNDAGEVEFDVDEYSHD